MRRRFSATRNPLNPALLRIRLGCALLAAVCEGGCTHAGRGSSSIELLEPAAQPPAGPGAKGDVSATNVIINAIPPSIVGELSKPAYPADALAAHAGGCVIFATITIDTKGNVSDVHPSWGRLSIPGRFSEAFFGAVRDAVRDWRFEPARNVYWEKEENGELRYLNTEVLTVQTDVKFTFEASGTVR